MFWTTVALSYLVTLALFLVPELVPNEYVYLIPSKRMIDPTFLEGDWSFSGNPWKSQSVLFHLLVAPIWWISDNPVTVAMIARGVFWAPLIVGILRLARHLAVNPALVVLGLAIWSIGFQSAGAGEWILRGIEQKVLAYTCVFWTLDQLFARHYYRAAVFAGLATCFHLLVGGWSLAAVLFALLVSWKEIPWRKTLRFAVTAFVVLAPFLLMGLFYLKGGQVETAQPEGNVAETSVILRNPHHLNPEVIMTAKNVTRLLAMVIMLGAAAWVGLRKRSPERLVIPFLAALFLLWPTAWMARRLELHWFLMFYPMRVGDTLLTLLFWIFVPSFALTSALNLKRTTFGRLTVAVLCLMICAWLLVPAFGKSFTARTKKTKRFWLRPTPTIERTYDWVRENTARTDTFLINPCHNNDFAIKTNRSIVVTFKSCPANERIFDWMERLKVASGQTKILHGGKKACRRLSMWYRLLTVSDLKRNVEKFGADYYLVKKSRRRLKKALAYRAGKWHVYDLSRI